MMRPGAVNLRSFHLGVDLGQRVDHTAFVVVEQQVVVTAHKDLVSYEYLRERKLYVRLVERVRLGQGYQEVVSEVERLTQCEEFKSGTVTTAVDATGLGIVVSEDLRRKRLRGGAVSGGDYGGGARGELPGWVLSDTTDGTAAGGAEGV